MESPNDMLTKIVGKVRGDADFRARLLRDPKDTIGHELGVALPVALSIEVHAEDGVTSKAACG